LPTGWWNASNPRMKFPHGRRLFLVLVMGLSFAAGPGAQAAPPANNYLLKVTPDRADALYRRGETVTFKVTLTLGGQPMDAAAVSWIISKDGVSPTQSGNKLNLIGGSATLTGKLDEPGFLQCRVTFVTPGKSNVVALAAAGVDPAEIKPSLPPPDDFDAFWAGQKKQLAAVPVKARLTPEKSPTNIVELFDLQADSIGAPVSGYFARPVGAKAKSLPVILTVHGAGVQSSSFAAATSWAARNFLALDINAHGIPNGRPKQFYADLASSELKDYRTRGRESRDTVYFRGMFLRLVRALDFLTAQPEWDGRTVVVHGSSQGGLQSIVAAGLDARVTFIAAGVPAGCDHTGFKAGRINGWPKFIATGEAPPPSVVEAVRYYDVVNFATRTKAAGIVTVGFVDVTCPPSSVYAAYNALPGKKEIFNDIAAGHTNTPKAVDMMRAAILAHVAAVKKQ